MRTMNTAPKQSRPGTNRYLVFCLAAVCLLHLWTGRGHAASGDRDHPIPLPSPELRGEIDSSGEEIFYCLTAGPGEIAITVEIDANRGACALDYELLDKAAPQTPLCSGSCRASRVGESARDVARARLAAPRELLLKLTSSRSGSGAYRVRLAGAIDSRMAGEQARSVLPIATGAHGCLRIELADGSVKEIALDRVRRITVEP